MVKSEFKEIWKCAYCPCEFDDEFDVEMHMQNSHLESPEEKTKKVYKCDVCKDEYNTFHKAQSCETKHAEGKDIKYQNWLDYQEKEKLKEAASHPGQKKLCQKEK